MDDTTGGFIDRFPDSPPARVWRAVGADLAGDGRSDSWKVQAAPCRSGESAIVFVSRPGRDGWEQVGQLVVYGRVGEARVMTPKGRYRAQFFTETPVSGSFLLDVFAKALTTLLRVAFPLEQDPVPTVPSTVVDETWPAARAPRTLAARAAAAALAGIVPDGARVCLADVVRFAPVPTVTVTNPNGTTMVEVMLFTDGDVEDHFWRASHPNLVIPDNAVEAGARALHAQTGGSGWDDAVAVQQEYRRQARAVLEAARPHITTVPQEDHR